MEMQRGRSTPSISSKVVTESTTVENAAAGSGADVTVLDYEHEDVMSEIDRIEEEHVREIQRIEAANRGSDYVSPFDLIKQPRLSAAEMKAQDDEELQHKMGMDMIADRNKLNQAFDVAAEKAKSQIEDEFGDNSAAAGGKDGTPMALSGRYTKDSTPEEVRNAALADVKQAEDEIKRTFRPNFSMAISLALCSCLSFKSFKRISRSCKLSK